MSELNNYQYEVLEAIRSAGAGNTGGWAEIRPIESSYKTIFNTKSLLSQLSLSFAKGPSMFSTLKDLIDKGYVEKEEQSQNGTGVIDRKSKFSITRWTRTFDVYRLTSQGDEALRAHRVNTPQTLFLEKPQPPNF